MDAASMGGLKPAETGPGLPRAFTVGTGRPFEEFYRVEVAGLVALAPRWSPDGRTIAYLHSSASPLEVGNYVVELVGAGGGNPPRHVTPTRRKAVGGEA